MQVKVFESADMTSGLKMVKKELGPDALIISTRTVRNGKLGLLGKPTLEITAAIDTAIPGNHSYKDTIPDTFRLEVENQRSGFNHVVDQSLDHLLQESPIDPTANQNDFSLHPSPKSRAASAFFADEVTELKNLVKCLSEEVSQLSRKNERSDSPPPLSRQTENYSIAQNADGLDQQKAVIRAMLKCKGINSDISDKITALLHEALTEEELTDSKIVTSTLIQVIQKLLHTAAPAFGSGSDQQRIAFVGPTGVGKTTTLAKIAASYLASHSHSIALITIDTYRIAAVEQLKVYGEIMRLPVDVVITPEQLKVAIEKHQDKDLILIDTAGRSPKDALCIAELATFLSPELNIDKHLVLSATTREIELLNTIERFNTLGITNTIFTKTDECSNLGILLNIQTQNSNPLSYVTNGQRVPEDLVEVSQNRVAELIMSQNEGLLHD